MKKKPVTLTAKDRKLGPDGLRYAAGWAYLDGRTVSERLHV